MKTVIEMACEAGFKEHNGIIYVTTINDDCAKELKALVDLVRADEREACAKLVEPDEEHRRDASWGYLGGTEGVELLDGMAAAIRARSNT